MAHLQGFSLQREQIIAMMMLEIDKIFYYLVRYGFFYLCNPAIIPQPTNEKTHFFRVKIKHPSK